MKPVNENLYTRLRGLIYPLRKTMIIAGLMAVLFFWCGYSMAQVTKTWVPTNGGSWTTTGNWSPSGVPGTGDHVLIPVDQTGNITNIGSVTISGLTISGNCNFISTAGSGSFTTLSVTQTFFVSASKTFTVGTNNAGRLNLVLSSTASGTINGTVFINSYTGSVSGNYDRVFTNNGNLTIAASGLVNGQFSSGNSRGAGFVLASGATLRIANTAGIAGGTGSGASGAITTYVRTFNAAAHYVYNGTANQNTGTGYPTALTGSLTVDNPNTVTIVAAARTITSGTLNLVQGTFATNNGGNRLSLGNNATINRSGGSMTGVLQGSNTYDVNFTGNNKTAGPELQNSGLRNVTVNLTTGQTLTSATNAFSTTGFLTVLQGTIDLQATDVNYTIAGNLTVASGATLKHSQDWDLSSRQIIVNGNLGISGTYDYSAVPRAHIGMYGAGSKTISTPNTALSILTLNNGDFSATGNLTVNDNFWAMFGAAGSFSTNGQTVTANASLLNNNGTLHIDGGTLNVSGGLQIGVGNNGNCVFSSGTLNIDFLHLGNVTLVGTFTHSGGIANISADLNINTGSSYTCTGSPAINLAGNFTRNGTFTAASSTLTLNGTAGQTIGGTAGTTFYNMVITNTTSPVVFGAAHAFSNNLGIATAAVADLGTFTHTALTLTMGGAGRAAGSWGHSQSTATYKNDVYFASNTGIINVSNNSCTTPDMAVDVSDVSCFQGDDGSITVTVTGGVADYQFSKDGGSTWTSPQASNQYTFGNLTVAGGPYTIVVRDGSGCVQTECTNP